MTKEIKIINFVFKYKEKLNLISIEEYLNFEEEAKIKLLFDDKYTQKKIRNISITNDKLIFDDVIITVDSMELIMENYNIKFNINCKELIEEYNKVNKGKNNYILFENQRYSGIINDNEVSDKLFVDFESMVEISDDYFKIYCIDFNEFSGCFNMVSYDRRTPNVILKYKDSIFKNKKLSNVRIVNLFKMTKYKLVVSGNYYWKINMSVNKTFKSNPSIIPFKYQKGNLRLIMKKSLFKTNLKALGKDMLLITYKYI